MMRALLAIALLLPLAPAPPGAAPLPDGCREDAVGYTCEFRTSALEGVQVLAGDPATLGRIPFRVVAFPESIVTISVELEGVSQGWLVFLEEGEGADARLVLGREVPSSGSPTQQRHRDTSTHYVVVDPSKPLWLRFWSYSGFQKVSWGDYDLFYTAAPVAPGATPARPAATAQDPHLRDDVGDVARPWLDVDAFWFDDAGIGDGLMDAHLKVANLAGVGDDREADEAGYFWQATFDLQGASYIARWTRGNECTVGLDECVPYAAQLRPEQWVCIIYRVDDSRGPIGLTVPTCVIDEANHTLHSIFPESALGNPGEGAQFEAMRAGTGSIARPVGMQNLGDGALTRPYDESAGERFPFALGGPEVWCGYRAASCVAPLAWYQAPMAAENLPNTLQVLGALLAASAFLVGLILVARRRSRLRKLLAELDRIARAHTADAAAGLVALGAFEDELDRRLERGRLTESEYQTVAHRLARAASRLAMRRDLGLDDGVPDRGPDASSARDAPTSSGVRR